MWGEDEGEDEVRMRVRVDDVEEVVVRESVRVTVVLSLSSASVCRQSVSGLPPSRAPGSPRSTKY